MLLLISLYLSGTAYATESTTISTMQQTDPNPVEQMLRQNVSDPDQFIQKLEEYRQHLMVDAPCDLSKIRAFVSQLEALLNSPQGISLSPLNKNRIQLLLGIDYCTLSNPLKAIPLLDQSLSFFKEHYKDEPNPYLRRAMMFRGFTARSVGDHMTAKSLLEQSIEKYRHDLPSAPLELAWAYGHLSYAYVSLSEYDKAKTAVENSIRIYQDPLTPKAELDFALAYSNLATVYYHQGNYEESIKYRLQSLELFNAVDPTHKCSGTQMTYAKLGMDYRRVGDYKKATEALKTSCLAIRENAPDDIDSLSWISITLGEVYRLLGNRQEALEMLQEGVDLSIKYFGANHIQTDWACIRLVQLYIDIEQYDKAKPLLERCLAGYLKAYGNIPYKMAWVYHPLALVHMHLGEMDKALSYFTKTQEIYAAHYGTTHTDYALLMKDFGLYYLLAGDYGQAETILQESLAILQAAKHIERYRCFEYLGDLYQKKGGAADRVTALNYYKGALKIIKDFPTNSFHKTRIVSKVQNLGRVVSSHL